VEEELDGIQLSYVRGLLLPAHGELVGPDLALLMGNGWRGGEDSQQKGRDKYGANAPGRPAHVSPPWRS
jgi:hypothetical protein